MQIRTVKNLVDGKYTVTISAEDFSEGEDTLMEKFGEPLVETGGTFTDGTISFTLGLDPRQLKSGMGAVTQIFDGADTTDAEQRANLWAITVQNRIRDAVTEVRSRNDIFTETKVEPV